MGQTARIGENERARKGGGEARWGKGERAR